MTSGRPTLLLFQRLAWVWTISLGSRTKERQHQTLVIGYGHGGVFAQL